MVVGVNKMLTRSGVTLRHTTLYVCEFIFENQVFVVKKLPNKRHAHFIMYKKLDLHDGVQNWDRIPVLEANTYNNRFYMCSPPSKQYTEFEGKDEEFKKTLKNSLTGYDYNSNISHVEK
jgi:hypothetical protein